ncbi:MAG TPA: hypothetical protein PKZ12_01155 [Smithellaceae bacterium]|nr:hypothetical protein [Smithellaceae bacterium]
MIKTDKDAYAKGEKIKVDFLGAPGSNRDWICIAPAGSPDTEAGDYQYMPGGASEGFLTFEAPTPGKYEVRAYYNYSRNGYIVTARYGFAVLDEASAARPAAVPARVKSPDSSQATLITAGSPVINVAVFHFTPLSVDATGYGITVTNALLNNPRMQSSFVLLGRKDLELFLSANNLQQNDDLENIIEIGTRLGLNYVIAGTVSRRGAAIVTGYKVVGIAQRNIIFAGQFKAVGESDLIVNVAKMSDALIETIRKSKN